MFELVVSWLTFTGTFAGLRALTYSIRAIKGPFRNVSVGGKHLHHYPWGIGMLSGVGAIAVAGSYFAALPMLRRLLRDWKQQAVASEVPAPRPEPRPSRASG
jgi:hypothetical protein